MAKKTSSKNTKSTTKTATKTQPKKAAAARTNGKPASKKARTKKEAAEAHAAASPEPKAAAKATKAAPRARDPRLPAPGTVLQKKDRQGEVRCECTVEEAGVRYQGTIYRSLSAAAMAASKDMGLGGRAQNGFLFWGLIKQPPRETNPVAALERAWERYESRAKGILETSLGDEIKAKVLTTVRKHAQALHAIEERGT